MADVVVFVAVAVVAEFVVLVDFYAGVLVIVELLFSVLDRLPCRKKRIAQSSIFDPPLEKNFVLFCKINSNVK